jgi:hypothetical protein
MTALELLDVDYPDPFVRFSAVRLLDTRIDDDRLLPVILQIVQVNVKYINWTETKYWFFYRLLKMNHIMIVL